MELWTIIIEVLLGILLLMGGALLSIGGWGLLEVIRIRRGIEVHNSNNAREHAEFTKKHQEHDQNFEHVWHRLDNHATNLIHLGCDVIIGPPSWEREPTPTTQIVMASPEHHA